MTRLRRDAADRIGRHLRRQGGTQSEWAAALGIPQPTLSQVVNGRIERLSLELLLRIAARAGLSLGLQQARPPRRHVAAAPRERTTSRSDIVAAGRAASRIREQRMTPAERAEAFLEHNEWMAALQAAGAARNVAR